MLHEAHIKDRDRERIAAFLDECNELEAVSLWVKNKTQTTEGRERDDEGKTSYVSKREINIIIGFSTKDFASGDKAIDSFALFNEEMKALGWTVAADGPNWIGDFIRDEKKGFSFRGEYVKPVSSSEISPAFLGKA